MVLRFFSSRIIASPGKTAPSITRLAATSPLSNQLRWTSTSSTEPSTPAADTAATADISAEKVEAEPQENLQESHLDQPQQQPQQLHQQDTAQHSLPITYPTPKPIPSKSIKRKVSFVTESGIPVTKYPIAPSFSKLPLGGMANFLHDKQPYIANTYTKPDIVLARGKGPWLWDLHGRRYIDFTSGIGVCSLGHADERVAEIISQQAAMLLHSSNLFHNIWASELCKFLVEATRISGAFPEAAKVFLCNSGTEANEAAIKFARRHARSIDPTGKKNEIVSFCGSFHGRTFGALSATPNEKYRKPFGPMLSGFKTGTFNDVEGLNDLITEDTAGVIVEPIQGEGGINPATPQFLRALRDRCDQVGAALIFDEIQCGLQRTGTVWAHRNPALQLRGDPQKAWAYPDILTSAKALGNGLPIGATLISDKINQCLQPGDHGTTFGGNPLACAVAHWVVKRLVCADIRNNVIQRSKQLIYYIQETKTKFPQVIKEKRGTGLMIGIQLTDEYKPKIGDIVKYCREGGLLVLTAGNGVIRLLPPLTIGKVVAMKGCRVLERAIRRVVMETEGTSKEVTEQREAEAVPESEKNMKKDRTNPVKQDEAQSEVTKATVETAAEKVSDTPAEETVQQTESETTAATEEKQAQAVDSQSATSSETAQGEDEKQVITESGEERKQ
ncbi:acetylornithine aminotransferase [Ascosphaera aggregata]|nr:acetylornithine aminotransferase [Ascosphaera aggregata]